MTSRLISIAVLIALVSCISGCSSYQTKPITDAQGQALSNSIASLERIKLGGVYQWILIRGKNINNPILLKLHGGPGQAEMATVGLNELLERDFVVVEWDQRGSGKSAESITPLGSMNINQFVEDTRELTELLLKRFGQKNLILVGHSWGSVIGLKAVQKSPQLYRAFVSTGQISNFSEGLNVSYQYLISEANMRNNRNALDDLIKIGPPPYIGADSKEKREAFGRWLNTFGGFWHSSKKFDRVGWMISSVEYSWYEKFRYTHAAEKSFELLRPQLAEVNMSTAVPKVDVPTYFAVGRYDQMAPYAISLKYFSSLIAPVKEWIWFEESAHFPQWEEMEKFHELLTKKILPATQQPNGASQ